MLPHVSLRRGIDNINIIGDYIISTSILLVGWLAVQCLIVGVECFKDGCLVVSGWGEGHLKVWWRVFQGWVFGGFWVRWRTPQGLMESVSGLGVWWFLGEVKDTSRFDGECFRVGCLVVSGLGEGHLKVWWRVFQGWVFGGFWVRWRTPQGLMESVSGLGVWWFLGEVKDTSRFDGECFRVGCLVVSGLGEGHLKVWWRVFQGWVYGGFWVRWRTPQGLMESVSGLGVWWFLGEVKDTSRFDGEGFRVGCLVVSGLGEGHLKVWWRVFQGWVFGGFWVRWRTPQGLMESVSGLGVWWFLG